MVVENIPFIKESQIVRVGIVFALKLKKTISYIGEKPCLP